MRTHFTSFLLLLPALVAASSDNLEYPAVARRQHKHRNARAGKHSPAVESPKRTSVEVGVDVHIPWPGYKIVDHWEGENFLDGWTFFNYS